MTADERVEFETDDGFTLEGIRHGAGPVWVVLGHMRPADMTSWEDFAETLAETGVTALTYNNRGYGASEGVADEYDVGTDARAAIAFARANGAQQVFYMGASMNGTAAMYVGAKEDLVGIAVLSGVPDFEGIDGFGSLPQVEAPKLFVAARDDKDRAEQATKFYESASEPKTLILYDTGGHGTAMFGDNGPELTQALLEFVGENRAL